MLRILPLLALCSTLLFLNSVSQVHHIVVGGGIMNYSGELKTGFLPENGYVNPNVRAGYEVQFCQKLLRATGYYQFGFISGADSVSGDPSRNLSFRSMIHNLYVSMKLNLAAIQFRKTGLIGLNKRYPLEVYLEAGIGVLYSNPRTIYEGNWVSLRNIGTEGQFGTGRFPPDAYAHFNANFVLGFGVTAPISKRFSINAFVNYNFTSTDYLDDVGGYYAGYDELINGESGKIAGDLAYRGRGNYPGKGDVRGDSMLDGFFVIGAAVDYSFARHKYKKPKFIKRI
jgi:hypothetical protein